MTPPPTRRQRPDVPSASTSPPPAAFAPAPSRPRVALETTLLLHGVPRSAAAGLANELAQTVREASGGRVEPALVGVVAGRAIVGMNDAELAELLAAPPGQMPKLNTSTLGLALFGGGHGATTVSATVELAAAAGVRVFATGGLGGVHPGLATRPDISADLSALARWPVAVVCSGCKSILDIAATRELLETLGVPVVGMGTGAFPAFYRREARVGGASVALDGRFDDVARLADFCRAELARSGRGVVVAHPIPPEHELPQQDWDRWLAEAEADLAAADAGAIAGRDVTPFILARVHERSRGATLAANIALVKANAALAAQLADAMAR